MATSLASKDPLRGIHFSPTARQMGPWGLGTPHFCARPGSVRTASSARSGRDPPRLLKRYGAMDRSIKMGPVSGKILLLSRHRAWKCPVRPRKATTGPSSRLVQTSRNNRCDPNDNRDRGRERVSRVGIYCFSRSSRTRSCSRSHWRAKSALVGYYRWRR